MKNKPIFSIKRRLISSISLLSLILLSASLWFSFLSVKHEVIEVYDARLGQSAKILLLALSSSQRDINVQAYQHQFAKWMDNLRTLADGDDDANQFGHPYEQNMIIQFYQNNKMLWSSDPTLAAFSADQNNAGFFDIVNQGTEWRMFQFSQPMLTGTKEYIVVAEKQEIRREAMNELIFSAMVPQLILFPSLILIVIWLINVNFRPIAQLNAAIAIRNVHKLDRIHIAKQTVELSTLVNTLNELLGELEKSWQREKRFTRMMSHELKTPLTILRLNADNALSSKNTAELKQDLGNILKGIDRTDRLLNQLLTLAKIESMSQLSMAPVDIADILKQSISQLAPLALHNHQELSFEGDSCVIDGDELLLGILFRNLIDNAIRYSGMNTHIRVESAQQDLYLDVTISDNGPAITKDVREKLFDLFYRANTEKGDGAGLGMAITKDIAALHNATVELLPRSNNMNIFRVRFSLAPG